MGKIGEGGCVCVCVCVCKHPHLEHVKRYVSIGYPSGITK